MTTFEHAMMGVNGALALGLQRRHGWQVVAWAGFASQLPDFDGLTILLGKSLFADGHRLWCHNLLVAGALAAAVGAIFYYFRVADTVQYSLAKRWQAFDILLQQADSPINSRKEMLIWMAVGAAAAYGHLAADAFVSIGRNLPVWGVPFLWPFSRVSFAYPLVPWGDAGVTVILVAFMFAMLRWPKFGQPLAGASFFAVTAYMIGYGHFRPLG